MLVVAAVAQQVRQVVQQVQAVAGPVEVRHLQTEEQERLTLAVEVEVVVNRHL
jgi:hypothetical protein